MELRGKGFVCKMYKLESIGSVDEAWAILFSKKGKPEALPPTSDALSLHVKRVHCKAIVRVRFLRARVTLGLNTPRMRIKKGKKSMACCLGKLHVCLLILFVFY